MATDPRNKMPRRSKPAVDGSPFRIKRVHEPKAAADGTRVLVDRLWPRGLSREAAALDLWMREIAPSDNVRRAFGHDPARWPAFIEDYQRELAGAEALLESLLDLAGQGPVTLLFAAKDEARNNAVVLKRVLDARATRKG